MFKHQKSAGVDKAPRPKKHRIRKFFFFSALFGALGALLKDPVKEKIHTFTGSDDPEELEEEEEAPHTKPRAKRKTTSPHPKPSDS